MLLNAVVFPSTIVAGRRFRAEGARKPRVALSGRDLAWRAGVVTLCVIVVTAASDLDRLRISPACSPSFRWRWDRYFVILHPRIGGPAAASVAAHVQAPLIGLGLSLLAVHLLGRAGRRVVVLRGRA